MYTSSAYTILDNTFWRNFIGINISTVFTKYTNPSATSIIAQKAAGIGNNFTQCRTSILLQDDNRPVIISCNTTKNKPLNNANEYKYNWEGGYFGTQGILHSTDYTKPAGNRFDFPIPSQKREISSIVPFSYYAHSGPVEYIPTLIVPNTSSIACPPNGHDLCCPNSSYIIDNPNSSYYKQQVSTLDQQITSLKTEFNTVFANLDKGQTAQLLSAINSSMNAGQLKNLLLNDSPLSDAVVTAFINKSGTPPGIFKDVIIPNSPVSDNVMPVLQTKLNSLPVGIAKQIRVAQTDITNRTLGAIAQDIKMAETQRSAYLTQLISFYVEIDSMQKAINLLEQENTVAADQTLLATYIADSNLVAAQQKFSSMVAANPEEQAYLDIQGMLLNLALQDKTVFEMDSAQETLVRNIAATQTGLASSNACAILTLVFAEECALQTPITNREQLSPFIINENTVSPFTSYLGDNIPNPFNNTTVIPYILPEDAEKGNINIYDVTGKLIIGYEVNNKNGSLSILASELKSGVYIYKLEINGEILGNKKMIIIKE